MKTIIAGSRDFTNWSYVSAHLHIIIPPWEEITEVVSGGATGVDALGERYAKKHKIPLRVFPADWDTHKAAAGPIRNREMADYADGLIAFWDGESKGTKNMIETMEKKSKWIVVIRTDIKWEKEMVNGVPKLNNSFGRFGVLV